MAGFWVGLGWLWLTVAMASEPTEELCFTDGQRLTVGPVLEATDEMVRRRVEGGELRVPAAGVVDCAQAPALGSIPREARFVRLGSVGSLFAIARAGESETELVLMDGTPLIVSTPVVQSLGRDPDHKLPATPVSPPPAVAALDLRVCLSDGQVLRARSAQSSSSYTEFQLARGWLRAPSESLRPDCAGPVRPHRVRPGLRTWSFGASGRLHAEGRPMGNQTEMLLLDGASVYVQSSALLGVSELRADDPVLVEFAAAETADPAFDRIRAMRELGIAEGVVTGVVVVGLAAGVTVGIYYIIAIHRIGEALDGLAHGISGSGRAGPPVHGGPQWARVRGRVEPKVR